MVRLRTGASGVRTCAPPLGPQHSRQGTLTCREGSDAVVIPLSSSRGVSLGLTAVPPTPTPAGNPRNRAEAPQGQISRQMTPGEGEVA